MKNLSLFALLVCLCLASGGCRSLDLPQQIPDAMKSACSIYSKSKPLVIQFRTFAIAHWNDKRADGSDVIPAEIKATLLELDGYLPELDRAGQAICFASEGLAIPDGKSIDWNKALDVTLKVAGAALDAKQKGLI